MAVGRYAANHENPKGPGDARPTALQIVADEHAKGKLAGKTILITGGSAGLGVETARALATTGATVYVTARDLSKGQKVIDELKKENPEAKLELLRLELDDLESVKACAKDFLSRSQQLNILILNAGVMACPFSKTKQGFEMQFGVDHLAHFLLFEELKPALLSSASPSFPSRVVSLSSAAHRGGPASLDDHDFSKSEYNPWVSYGRAKSSNILFAAELDRLYSEKNLHACSVHPGGINTELQRHMDQKVVEGWKSNDKTWSYFKSAEQGAATTVWAALTPELKAISGKYLDNCDVAGPAKSKEMGAPGYQAWAYGGAGGPTPQELWAKSLELVGLS